MPGEMRKTAIFPLHIPAVCHKMPELSSGSGAAATTTAEGDVTWQKTKRKWLS
jgi:hypothetical protein